MPQRRVGSYPAAIYWIALNDDNEWLHDETGSPSVTLSLVADVFGRSIEEATHDLRETIKRDAEGQARLSQARAYAHRVIRNLPA